MRAHADDLRAEVADREDGEALVRAVSTDYRAADLTPADRAMLDYAVKLTHHARSISATDVAVLRAQGFDDEAIHHIAQITGLFAYYNRLADGLGVEDEPEWSAPGAR